MGDPKRAETLPAEPAERTGVVIGTVLARKYKIEAILGQGAMGTVYRARQVHLDKTVAVKILHPTLSHDSTFAQRFTREALAASRLDHPGIVRILDFGEEADRTLYLVMELLEGAQLFDLLNGPIPREQVVELLSQTLDALGAAHDAGVVHRDVKPENIMVVAGPLDEHGARTLHLKLLDFGIAVLGGRDAARKLTTVGMVMGTPEYMSPEQARGEATDARSDLYSVGVILYQMLCGELPFVAQTPMGVALRHVTDVPRPPSTIFREVDPQLEAICLRALAKSPSDRFESARAFRAELKAALEGKATTTMAPSLAPPTRIDTPIEAPRRGPSIVAVAAIVAVGLFGAFAIGRTCAKSSAKDVAISASPSVSDLETNVSSTSSSPSMATADTTTAPSHDEPGQPSASVDGITTIAPSTSHTIAKLPYFPGHTPTVTTDDSIASLYDNATTPPTIKPVTSATVATISSSTNANPKQNVPLPPSATAVDASKAHVTVGAINVTNGVPPSSVRKILDVGAFTRCYRAALTPNAGKIAGTGVLHLITDDDGRITNATFKGNVPSSVGACICGSTQGARVANVDTGAAAADVSLGFALE